MQFNFSQPLDFSDLSTQPPIEMSTKNLPFGGGGVKGGRRVQLTTARHLLSDFSRESGSLDVSQLYKRTRHITDNFF
jgi:hypothetical protein